MDINQINIEIGVFLKRLRMYSDRKNVQINDKTAELLLDVVVSVDKLIANAEMIPKTGDDNTKFIFDLNDQQFDLRQYIMCRLCVEQIGMSKDDLDSHLQRNANVHKPQPIAKLPGSEVKRSKAPAENGQSHVKLNHVNGIPTVGDADKDSDSDDTFTSASVVEQRGETKRKKESVPFNRDSTWLIHVSGFPWVATKDEILAFFNDVSVLNGVDGIHFIINETKNKSNEAFIQLSSDKDVQLAKKRKMIISRCVMSNLLNISLQPSSTQFSQLLTKKTYPLEQRVLRIEQLPSNSSSDDIKQYFNGRSISSIHFVYTMKQRYELARHSLYLKMWTKLNWH
ncbi:uncharacterized protein LOC116349147 [Contarinia nasturtii]|uniref:uncharacterized protein LOC116349147 n=1 Tax=Contarinia nasturtii TaxID=265458 RepID=UPI0012D37FDA|nr:uncharacterized protein LOC116349147 [Contarinia nasturtii]